MMHLRQGYGAHAHLRQGFGGQGRGRCFASPARRARPWFLVCVLALGGSLPAVGAQSAQPEGLTVAATVDRPAIWVADRVSYTVEIACPRGIDILTGDLGRDKLKLTGLEIVSSDTHRFDEADGVRYVVDYVLTTYRVDVATPTIGSFPVRYYLTRAGQPPEEAAPSGSVIVPPVSVAFRSLLPDDQAIYDVRDQRDLPPQRLPYRILQPLGIGLILLSVVPVAFLVAGLARGLRARQRIGAARSVRRSRQSARAALEDVRGVDAADPAARREAFARLDAVLRQHVAGVCGVPASGMTPEEIEAALGPCGARVPVDLVASVLAACELARYAGPEQQPREEAWRAAVEQAEQILGHG
jgi:hypothetical protein